MMKPISLKIEEDQLKLLEAVSAETHIPKSTLIREGLDFVIRQHREDIVSADLQKEIHALIDEDKDLLKKLAKA
ncbi:MAG TPA: ribbon-helix-helix domain-containing protein [Candidatus Omnitrophota bacterium]|nr:ribbon-helix-helix domain-containing protein [Candidatus Omnitrophota bacterium]